MRDCAGRLIFRSSAAFAYTSRPGSLWTRPSIVTCPFSTASRLCLQESSGCLSFSRLANRMVNGRSDRTFKLLVLSTAQRDEDRLGAAGDEQHRGLVAGCVQRAAEVFPGPDRLAVDLLDHVAFAQTGVGRSARVFDARDHHALDVTIEVQLPRD